LQKKLENNGRIVKTICMEKGRLFGKAMLFFVKKVATFVDNCSRR